MDKIWHYERCSGRIKISLELFGIGEDYLILLTGGKSHVGCVGLFTTEENRFLCQPGHQEKQALELLKNVIREYFSRPVAVIGGIHFTDLIAKEIADVLRLVRELADDLAAYLKVNKNKGYIKGEKLMLTSVELEKFIGQMKSGELERKFKNGDKAEKVEILELLEKIMDAAEIADELATRLIYRGLPVAPPQ